MRRVLWLLLCFCLLGATTGLELNGIVMVAGAASYTPVADAEVRIQGTDRVARTDAAGHFSFGEMTPGAYTVVASKDGAEARGSINLQSYTLPAMALVMAPRGTSMFGLTPLRAGTVYVALCTREGQAASGGGGGLNTTFSYPAMIINEWAEFMRLEGALPSAEFARQTPMTTSTDAFMLLPPDNLPFTGYQNAPGFSPVWLAFRPDGKKLYAACNGGLVKWFDPHVLRPEGTLETRGVVTDLVVTRDGRFLVMSVLDASPRLLVVDTATHKEQKSYDSVVGQPQALAAAADGSILVVGSEGLVARVDPSDGHLLGTGVVGKTPTGIALADNRVLVANSDSGDLSVLTYPDLKPAGRLRVGLAPRKVAVAGNRIFVSLFGKNQVAVLDANGPTLLSTPEVDAGPVGLAVSPDQTVVYCACREAGTVVALDARTGAVLFRTSPQPMSAPFGLTVHP